MRGILVIFEELRPNHIFALCVGASLKCLRNPHDAGKVSGEEGRWAALSDRTLVPLADSLLAHVAK